jgi:hypothetical protein
MSNWITDRLPTVDDAMADGKVWTMYLGNVVPLAADRIPLGSPWQPIPRPAPYAKPKRWTVEYNRVNGYWVLVAGRLNVPLYYLTTDDVYPAVERICDIYNEALP